MNENDVAKEYFVNPQVGFERIYRTYSGQLIHYSMHSFGFTKSEAEDIVHDALLPWVAEPEKMKRIENPVAYIFVSVRNLSISRKTRNLKNLNLETVESKESILGIDPDITIIVERALEKLSEGQREVVVLKIWSDLHFEEIANIQGVSIQTAASRYRYALQKLKELIPWQT